MTIPNRTYEELPKTLYQAQRTARGTRFNPYQKPSIEDLSDFVFIKEGDKYIEVKVIDLGEREILPPVDDEVQNKKDRLLALNEPSFHFLDASAVPLNYTKDIDNKKENLLPDKTQVTQTRENLKKAGITPPKIELGAQDKIEILEEYKSKPERVETRFMDYQRFMILDEKVILDLEFENRKPDRLAQFDNVIRWLRQYYPSTLNTNDSIETIRRNIGELATEEKLDSFRTHRVIVEGQFAIEPLKENKSYVNLSCVSPGFKDLGQEMLIQVTINKDKILQGWQDQYEIQKDIRATIFGIPVSWDGTISKADNGNQYRLVILKAIAIYT